MTDNPLPPEQVQMAGPVESPPEVADGGVPAPGPGAYVPLLEGARGFGPPPSKPEGGGLDIRRYLAALFRYKWMIFAVTILGSIAGVGATRFLTPTYQTQGTFWIERPQTSAGPIQTSNLLNTSAWIALLRSFEVLETVAREQRLWVSASDSVPIGFFAGLALTDSVFTGAYRIGSDAAGSTVTLSRGDHLFSQTVPVGESIGQAVGLDWRPPANLLPRGSTVEFEISTPREVAIGLNSRLAASTDQEASFLRVRLLDTQGRRSARILNAIMVRYVDLAADIKRERLSEMTVILDEQLDRSRRSLESAENELESFKVRTITLPSEPAVPVVPGLVQTTQPAIQGYFTMKTEEDLLRQDREALIAVLERAPDSGLRTDAIEVIVAAASSSELMALLGDLTTERAQLRGLLNLYTEQNPQVIRQRELVTGLEEVLVPRQLQILVEEVRSREAALRQRIASAGRQLQEIPQRKIQEDRLTRTRDIAVTLYKDLEQRFQQAQLAEASTVPDVRILDRAVAPRNPTSNRAPVLILMGFGLSLAFGVIGALVLDQLDRRVRYPEQITKDLGLPILGVIPRVEGNTIGGHFDPVIESFRGIRMNLVHSIGTRGPVVVTVTSAGGGDGKSFTASNLALAFAEAGHRTLLIDGDVRRGQLHRLFGVARKPGITDILQGEATRDEATRETEYSSLSFIACGTRTHAAPELLGSAAMNQLLQALRGTYGVIIVDSPPMSAGIDSLALGALTQNMLVVIRTGTTNRELAGAKLDVLDRLPVRVLGAVLNDVKPGVDGYYYGYYSYYLPGYTTDDESFGEAPGSLVEQGTES